MHLALPIGCKAVIAHCSPMDLQQPFGAQAAVLQSASCAGAQQCSMRPSQKGVPVTRAGLTSRSAGSGLAGAGMSAPTSFTLGGSGRGCSSAKSPPTRCISSSSRASFEAMSSPCFFLQYKDTASEDATISIALRTKAVLTLVGSGRCKTPWAVMHSGDTISNKHMLQASAQKGGIAKLAR